MAAINLNSTEGLFTVGAILVQFKLHWRSVHCGCHPGTI